MQKCRFVLYSQNTELALDTPAWALFYTLCNILLSSGIGSNFECILVSQKHLNRSLLSYCHFLWAVKLLDYLKIVIALYRKTCHRDLVVVFKRSHILTRTRQTVAWERDTPLELAALDTVNNFRAEESTSKLVSFLFWSASLNGYEGYKIMSMPA